MFVLFKSLKNLDRYGNVPDIPDLPDDRVETYRFLDGDRELLAKDFVDSANEVCNSTLDLGDVDYFDEEQCRSLIEVISTKKSKTQNSRLKKLYGILEKYAEEAMKLHTGIMIEL